MSLNPRKLATRIHFKKGHVTFFFCCAWSALLGFSLHAQIEPLRFDNFTLENGLSNNIVHCIYQDSRGWIWSGTSQGLNRFDGYKFTVYKNQPGNVHSLSGTLVRTMFEDKSGNLWIGNENGGLNKFDRAKENFTRYFDKGNPFGNSVNAIAQRSDGKLWIGTEKGLCLIEPETAKVMAYYHQQKEGNSVFNDVVRALLLDRNDILWIGTDEGLDCYDARTEKFQHISLPSTKANDQVLTIYEDPDGLLWIGTYNCGLFVVNPVTREVKHLDLDAGNDRSLTVRAIVRDNQGKYWIGTRGGLYIYSKELRTFSLLLHDEREQGSLSHNSVLSIFRDKKGDIWIGTRSGISYLASQKQIFRYYSALPNDNKHLNDNEIYVFWIDKDGEVWIGTEKGGINILNRHTGTFRYLLRDPKNPNSISKNCVKAFLDDQEGNLWIGTFMGGIDVLQMKTGRMTHYVQKPGDVASLGDNRIYSLFRDWEGHIWIGTVKGLDRFEPKSKKFMHCNAISGNQSVLWLNADKDHRLWVGGEEELVIYDFSANRTYHIKEHTRGFYQDSRGRIWLTTLDKGLALYNKASNSFKFYDESKGLSNNQAFCIQEDNQGQLWISTGNGLSRFDPEKETFRNFDKADGLQNNQFTYGASFKASTGELLFGGIAGFNIFYPQNVKDNNYTPPVVFTDFRIFNKSVPVTEGKKRILSRSITEAREVVLPFDQNVITIEFAALDFAQSNKNKYAFILDGFEKNWNEAGTQHTVTYTNLNPGSYVLKVRASCNSRTWNAKSAELHIKILPPFWKTWWFKTIMLLFIFSIIYLLILFLTNRSRLKHKLVFERLRANKMHELDMMKLRFFTNISHEIRTPLTLILGPLEKMQNSEMPRHEIKSYLAMMHRNATQLSKLINQLLDYRKLESGNLKVELSQGDLISFIRSVVRSFEQLAYEKEINLKFNTAERDVYAWFDPDKLEKIMNNLISNALKFTEKNGSVRVNVTSVKNANGAEEDRSVIEITVSDTGVGIPSSSLNKIFNRFFQVANSLNNTGTGIGLALTKELVKLHKGEIFVESNVNQGSKFTVRLPVDMQPERDSVPGTVLPELEISVPGQGEVSSLEENSSHENILLVVEDNPDVRYFIRDNFEPEFRVIEASDGKEGWQQALKVIPDVVISDVLMPGMSGKELCRKLKKDERTSHIPVILLTALTSKESEREGLVAGADDYIAKPFDISILKTKVENLFLLRKSLKEKYTGEMVLKPANVTLSSPDERFLHRAIEVVEKNIDDPDLDIDKFATELSTSRMQLYRKMAALTDMTVKEFIRDIRLKRAAQLLLQKKITISEVAYAVGFRDLSHFRKCFRQQFGMNASEYIDQKLGEEETMNSSPAG